MTYADLNRILGHYEDRSDLLIVEDCLLLQGLIQGKFHVEISLHECQELWQQHSATQDAQWLGVAATNLAEIWEATYEWAQRRAVKQVCPSPY